METPVGGLLKNLDREGDSDHSRGTREDQKLSLPGCVLQVELSELPDRSDVQGKRYREVKDGTDISAQ